MLEFGKVVKYLDNGFGFIKPISPDSALYKKEIFFHIKAVKKFEGDLVKFTDGAIKDLYFWFICKDGKKGKEVLEFWADAKDIPQEHTLSILEKYADNLIAISKPPVEELPTADPLSAKSLASKYSFTPVQSEELSQLLNDMSEKEFRLSSELSKYITSNKLGDQYPNIAGIVTMANDDNEWDFDGGFPKGIYRIICQELGLRDKGTSARAIKFTSYQDQKNQPDIIF